MPYLLLVTDRHSCIMLAKLHTVAYPNTTAKKESSGLANIVAALKGREGQTVVGGLVSCFTACPVAPRRMVAHVQTQMSIVEKQSVLGSLVSA